MDWMIRCWMKGKKPEERMEMMNKMMPKMMEMMGSHF